jgi:hypothetical protein
MGLVLNLVVQTIVWFGFMGAVIFGAAGTMHYTGGWLYLGEMIAISVVLGLHVARRSRPPQRAPAGSSPAMVRKNPNAKVG